MALVEMSVVEQRYPAVLAVGRGEPKIVWRPSSGNGRCHGSFLDDIPNREKLVSSTTAVLPYSSIRLRSFSRCFASGR